MKTKIALSLALCASLIAAEEPKKEEPKKDEKTENVVELPKYSTADKVAITVFTATIFTITGMVMKELIVDGAYGVRE